LEPPCFYAGKSVGRRAKNTGLGSIAENQRVANGKVVQRYVLYLGKVNDPQEVAWRKSIELFGATRAQPMSKTVTPFPEDRMPEAGVENQRLFGLCSTN